MQAGTGVHTVSHCHSSRENRGQVDGIAQRRRQLRKLLGRRAFAQHLMDRHLEPRRALGAAAVLVEHVDLQVAQREDTLQRVPRQALDAGERRLGAVSASSAFPRAARHRPLRRCPR